VNLRINPQIKAVTFFYVEPTEPVLGLKGQERYLGCQPILVCATIVNQKFKGTGNAKFTLK
jgi:hypothetical protein